MEQNLPRDWFAPILDNNALIGSLLLVARVFAIAIFAFYIANEIFEKARMEAYMDKYHVPGNLLYLALAVQLVGSVLVLLGYKTRFASLMLAGFCIVASVVFNIDSRINILKDVAIAGGFFFMFANGPGPFSVDALQGRADAKSYRGVFASILNNNAIMGPLLLVGRIFAAAVFLFFGNNKVIHNAQMQAYMVKNNAMVPTVLIFPALVLQLVAGTLLVLGYKTRYASLSLSGFCIIATVLFHAQFGKQAEVIQFLTDFTLAGVLLFTFAFGPGPFSLDARQRNPKLASVRA